MKKILLSLVAVFATMTAFADDNMITKKFSPVSDASQLGGVHTTVATDGSVYASSTINQSMTFAGSVIAPEGDLMSSCVVKYDISGDEKWAVLLYGSSTVRAMTTDADGNIYVAGTFQDTSLDLIGTDGEANKKTAAGNIDKISAFVAKIDPDGKALAITALTSVANSYIQTVEIPDPWDWESEMPPLVPAYSPWDPIEVTPSVIRVDGDKVYVGAEYTGNVTALGWDGRYWTDDFGFIYDNYSVGVFSLSKSDLTSPTSVCNIGSTNKGNSETEVAYNSYSPDCINFVVKDGNVYAAFFGWGDLTLTAASGAQPFSFDKATSNDVSDEHALVLSDLSDVKNRSLQFRAPNLVDLNWSANFRINSAEIVGSNVYIAGSFGGQFALDNEKFSPKNSGDQYLGTAFVASRSLSTPNSWSWVNEEKSVCNAMIVTGEEIHMSTESAVYHFKTSDGTAKGSENFGVLDAAQANDQYIALISTDEAKVVVDMMEIEPTAVEAVKAATVAGGAKIYGIDGVELSAPQKGLNIVKTADGVIKIAK